MILASIVLAIIAIVLAALTFKRKSLFGSRAPPANTIMAAELPVTGVQFTVAGGAITYVAATWWDGILPPTEAPYTNIVPDLSSVFSGNTVWDVPTDDNALFTWFGSKRPTTHTAYCPAGEIVTGVTTVPGTSPTTASMLNVQCMSAFDVGASASTSTPGTVVANGAPDTPIDLPTTGTVTSTVTNGGLYLTANNFLQGSSNWSGTLNVNQTAKGPTSTLPAFVFTGLTIDSAACSPSQGQGFADPSKPSSQNFGSGSGGIPAFNLTFKVKWFDVGTNIPSTQTISTMGLDWTGQQHTTAGDFATWTFTTPSPTINTVDASRNITESYDNGAVTSKGIAIVGASWSISPGPTGTCSDTECNAVASPCTGNNVAGGLTIELTDPENLTYTMTVCHDCAVYTWVIGLNMGMPMNTTPTGYLLGNHYTPRAYAAAAAAAKPTVTDPTCTGILPSMFDSTNPINEGNIGISTDPRLRAAEAKCMDRATALCKSLSADDPYCSCINSTKIPGLGDDFSNRCLSNGHCMNADVTKTMMDYTCADQASPGCSCGTINLDACSVLFKLDADTIILNNIKVDCPSAPDTCDNCVGSGPCISGPSAFNQRACRPRDPETGGCGEGFTDCRSAPPPAPAQSGGSMGQGTVWGIAGAAILLVLFVTVLIHMKRKK